MNTNDLYEIQRRAISKEISPKEVTDTISQIWYLLKLNAGWNLGYTELLMDITIDLCKAADNNWQQRWADSIPTDMKAVEILKKILQERGIKTS